MFLERDPLLARRTRSRARQPHHGPQLVRLQLAGDSARLPRRRVIEQNGGQRLTLQCLPYASAQGLGSIFFCASILLNDWLFCPGAMRWRAIPDRSANRSEVPCCGLRSVVDMLAPVAATRVLAIVVIRDAKVIPAHVVWRGVPIEDAAEVSGPPVSIAVT